MATPLEAYTSKLAIEAFTADDAPTAFSETMAAAFALTRREELIDSASRAFRDKNLERAKKIKELGGDENLASYYGLGLSPQMAKMLRDARLAGALDKDPFWRTLPPLYRQAFEQQMAFEQQFPDQVKSDDMMMADFKKESAELRAVEHHKMQTGSGWASFLGMGGAIFTDPLVLATLPFGAGEIKAGASLLQAAGRTAAIEGSIAAAVEIPIQTQVLKFKREIDSPWSLKDSAINVLSAGVGGFGIGGLVGGGVVGARKALASYKARKAAGLVTDDAMDEAENILEDTLALHDENPLESPVVGEAGAPEPPPDGPHERAFEDARAQHEAGQPVDVARDVQGFEPADPVNDVLNRAADPNELVSLDPLELKVDAETFQFKSGSDAQGVTDALKGVTKFDQRLAGVSLIWENKAGERFIADGHQRQALATRALEAGQDPAEVKINGFILREADGISAQDARQMAAIKNMAEGTGTAVDAAKILRGVGPAGEVLLPPLPPNSALVRDARGLANLGEDEFMQVVNGVIDQRQGALVGAATSDPQLQSAMIKVLKRTNPANDTQARSIIDQVRTAGTETRITEDLFGETQVTESLYLERAQVLDAALREARKDKQVFGRLVAEEDRIVAGGQNQLDSAANAARMTEASNATQTISRLANSRGPISEALTAAAREVKAGKKPGDVAANFLETTRREILAGDSGGGKARGARSGDQPAGAEKLTDYDYTPSQDLTPEGQVIEARFMEKLRTTPWEDLKAEYAALEDAKGGQVLAGDIARELSPDYVKDRRLAPEVHEPSSAFIKRLYAERLAAPLKKGETPEVIFTAGGTGAGKTTGLEYLETAASSKIIMDGNLANPGSAIKKIDQAIAAGLRVTVNYVYRDPIEAWLNGVMKRAMKQFEEFGTGRTVPIDVHAATHAKARSSVEALAKKYADEPLVDIMVIDNSNGKGKARPSSIEKIPNVEENRVLEEGQKLIQEAEADGRINKEVAEGLKQQEANTRRTGSATDGGLDQPGDRQRTGSDTTAKEGGLRPASQIDAAPRSIVRAVDDPTTPLPDASRTGTVPDSEYEAVLAQADDLIEQQGAMAKVTREVNGELETRSLGNTLEELDTLEESIEQIRICSASKRGAA